MSLALLSRSLLFKQQESIRSARASRSCILHANPLTSLVLKTKFGGVASESEASKGGLQPATLKRKVYAGIAICRAGLSIDPHWRT
jgi:hypothetical protein